MKTLKEVKDAMKINYFDDKALIEAQAERFSKQSVVGTVIMEF